MSAREDSEFAKDPVRAVLEYGYASEIKPSLDLLLMLAAVRRTNSERRHLSSVREDLVHELETLQSIAGANGSEADSAEAVKRIGYQIATLEAHMSRGTLLPRPAGPTERIFSRLKRRCVRAMKRGQHQ